jgi:maltooligosyltrehalose trehalohydrolase
MKTLRVWAPKSSSVELSIAGKRLPMKREGSGYWSIETDLLSPKTDYAFVLKDGDPLPDPRSNSQPHGVHGPSRMVDHAAFRWSDKRWNPPPLSSAIIYELHVGTFTPGGTFDSAIKRLPYLVDLGVTHVELMPVAEFSGDRGWGYDGVDLYAPHHAYGGPDGLKRLVDACHASGLAVVLDVVYNHFGPAGNYLPRFGPYLTDKYRTPWGGAVNFDDRGSFEVRRFLCESGLMWLRDYHFDALRLDAIHAILDTSAVHFLEQLASAVKDLEAELGRRLALIAESDLNDPRIIRPIAVGGYSMTAQWSDDFHHALHAYLTGDRSGYYADFGALADLAKALNHAYVYDGRYSNHRERNHGRPANGLSGDRFVAYSQNHDQVGNRAKGDRSSALINTAKLKIVAALVMFSPFVPMLLQGEEWGASTPFLYFTDHPDPELGRAVSEGRKREFASFGWNPADIPDPQALESFTRSKLDWSEIDREPHKALLEWHRMLITLRKRCPELCDGRRDRAGVLFDENEGWLVFWRYPSVIVCNFGNEARAIALPRDATWEFLLTSATGVRLNHNAVDMPPESTAILRFT